MSNESRPRNPHDHDLLVFGEILYDRFPDGEAVLGGAPFNVAWNLRGLGAKPLLISRVGDDRDGLAARAAMASWGLDGYAVQTDPDHPTGGVRVTFEDDQPTYAIEPEQAYDFIDAEAVPGLDLCHLPVYHGTLALRGSQSRRSLRARIAKGTPPVFLDINLRTPWWRAEDFPALLQRSRWIKLNEHELDIVAETLGLSAGPVEHRAALLRARFDAEWVVVTRGAQGACSSHARDGVLRIKPDTVAEVVDTVGAGDAFSAVMLLGIIKGWPTAETLVRAQSLAGRVCGLRGAISRNLGFYQAFQETWGA